MHHTLALMADGTVKSWGWNGFGQLGDGTTVTSSTPVTVTGLGGAATAIAAGAGHTVALLSNGTLKAWGDNISGSLGNGTTINSSTPITVIGLSGTVTAIAAGGPATVALMADGTVKAWGYNEYGALGNGTTTSSSTPVTVTGTGGIGTLNTATGIYVKAGSSYFGTISAGYAALSSGGTLLLQALGFSEQLLLNRAISFTLKGGHDNGFSSQVGMSTIHGALIITSGTVTVDGIVIQ
jgi:hypothetical protein